MKYQSLRGMKGILPEETPLWQIIEKTCDKNFQRFNYHEIRTPVLEMSDLFTRAVGGNTDIVSKEMYSFVDRGNRKVTLRPEATAAVVRACLQHNLISKDKLTKLFYFGPMFRYERPQAGRYRQFHQVGIETFGSASPAVDAETILLAVKIFRDLGLSDLEVDINSVGCNKCRPNFTQNLKHYLKGSIVKMCEDCHKRYQHNTMRVLDCKKPKCQHIIEEAPSTVDFLCDECRVDFESLLYILKNLGINFKVNKRLVRGLDYYTKTTYEIVSNVLGAQNAVCGGGRYDKLVSDLGGPEVPAVGFAIGLERLVEILKTTKALSSKPQAITLYFAPLGDKAKISAIEYLHKARQAGISADMDYFGKKLKAQLKNADRLGALYALILGDDELSRNTVILRDMISSSQTELSFEEALKKIK
ncbi:MAG: histidine--tRNA ligase [Candidatus Saganbacteria bacterium]|nr:histidine--tRNA ligase [Candidatus Saganbacteria bacterium]